MLPTQHDRQKAARSFHGHPEEQAGTCSQKHANQRIGRAAGQLTVNQNDVKRLAVDRSARVLGGFDEFPVAPPGLEPFHQGGNGFQSLYAHLSAIYRFCGQSVGQGEGIGAIGNTGNSSGAHLHFELMTPGYKVNPWDFLPPP